MANEVCFRTLHLDKPWTLATYRSAGGYEVWEKILREKITPDEIIAQMKASVLRGRGGAGFPTGLKWKFAAGSKSDIKYVLCNADEGDPGAFMDRSVLEADPHAVLEGMVIAAKAISGWTSTSRIKSTRP